MADNHQDNRPLSPFMIGQYYRPQWTSVTSILVRITGVAVLFLAVLVVWWLLAAAGSESAFLFVDGLLRSWLGQLIWFGAAWALWYHMLGRLRHVIWDFGFLLEIGISEKMGMGMCIGATVLAVITMLLV